MKTSEAIDQISTALAAAQAEITNPVKDSENPHFKSTYADLAGGLSVARPVLAKHGIAIIQATSLDGDVMMLETRLAHKSGQWVATDYPVCKFPIPQQQAGSALTYARRYSLFSLVGIAGEDDDGNEASKVATPAPAKKEVATITAEQVESLSNLIDEVKANRAKFVGFFNIKQLEALPAERFFEAVQMLEAKRQKAAA